VHCRHAGDRRRSVQDHVSSHQRAYHQYTVASLTSWLYCLFCVHCIRYHIDILTTNAVVITHADNSRGSKAFSGVCVCVRVCVSPHDKTKTAETTITKLATDSPSRVIAYQSINVRSKGQKSRSQGHKMQKYIEGDRVAGESLHSI